MSAALDSVRRSHPGHDWFEIDVHLRRTADGQVRVCRDIDTRGGWRFQWSENNYSCDCNRYLFFERAGARETDPMDDEYECGEGAYAVERIVDVATGEVLIEGDPRG